RRRQTDKQTSSLASCRMLFPCRSADPDDLMFCLSPGLLVSLSGFARQPRDHLDHQAALLGLDPLVQRSLVVAWQDRHLSAAQHRPIVHSPRDAMNAAAGDWQA